MSQPYRQDKTDRHTSTRTAMSLHNGAYSHRGYSAPPYSQGYHHPPGGQMYSATCAGHRNSQVCYAPNDNSPPSTASSSTHSSQQQRYWYGQHRDGRRYSGGGRGGGGGGGGWCSSPESDRFNRKRRRCTYMYYVLRQLAIILPLVVVFLNVNIYVSRRGRYLNDSTSPADPIFYAMWLSVPLSVLLMLWSLTTVIFRKREAAGAATATAVPRGGIPKHVHFGMELCLSLGSAICWTLLVIQIESKKSNGFYAYPYIQYEAALAFLLGLVMVSEFGLLARAWFEFSNDRTRHDSEAMVQVGR